MIRFLLVFAFLVIATITEAQTTPLISCPHDDTFPITCTYALSSGSGTADMGEAAGVIAPGTPCAAGGPAWNRDRFASGGYNNGPYHLYTLWDWDCTGGLGADNSWGTGWYFDPPGTNTWPTATGIYLRARLYFQAPLAESSPNDWLKFGMWNIGSGGDHRVMLQVGRGDSPVCSGGGATTHVCLMLMKNIDSGNACGIAVPVGQWGHVQFMWRHGAAGVAQVKCWLNNDDEASPTDSHTLTTALNVVSYDGAFAWAGRHNEGLRQTEHFPVRMMHLEIDDAFDPNWAGGTAPPIPPPVNCVTSEWSAWAATGPPSACINNQQLVDEARSRTILTPPSNGGLACGPLSESRTVTLPCVSPPIPPLGCDIDGRTIAPGSYLLSSQAYTRGNVTHEAAVVARMTALTAAGFDDVQWDKDGGYAYFVARCREQP